ncbi:MAG: hypothetical protein RRY47_06185, partial [Oscillospiraceae bacterium]
MAILPSFIIRSILTKPVLHKPLISLSRPYSPQQNRRSRMLGFACFLCFCQPFCRGFAGFGCYPADAAASAAALSNHALATLSIIWW